MHYDLVIRHAQLHRRQGLVDIAIHDGHFAKIAGELPTASTTREIDAAGRLVSPPFIDAHVHLDAVLTVGQPRYNTTGTLLEGIALWGELKPSLTQQAIVERALAYCDWAAAQGLLAIRSHVDICDPRLLAVDALLVQAMKVRHALGN